MYKNLYAPSNTIKYVSSVMCAFHLNIGENHYLGRVYSGFSVCYVNVMNVH